ncbi:citrate/2-methylcitrate synthase [Dyella sp.]|uniref:citrate/2-methylcitrate synthase n=1 Tax=Dyella sp. TaxID=1869338 RepID=UPI002ECFCACD
MRVNLDRIDQPVETHHWLSATQALDRLHVLPQTLYAYASRGRIRVQADPHDPRRSLYHRADVERLARRRAGRHSAATIAADAIDWGAPVLRSSLSAVVEGRLYYRGIDAVKWARNATLESTAQWLWETPVAHFGAMSSTPEAASPLARAMLALASDIPIGTHAPLRAELIEQAQHLVTRLAHALLGPSRSTEYPLHLRMAEAWNAPQAADLFRQALVLLTDHELNASTFATRIAASTGASMQAALLAGLSTLSGPAHGAASLHAWAAIRRARSQDLGQVADMPIGTPGSFPAFGHPLYPQGDPRASALLAQWQVPPHVAQLQAALEQRSGEKPNIDFALAALAESFALDAQAPMIIFTLARSVGWIAHYLEQIESGALIRPRAAYSGPPIVT